MLCVVAVVAISVLIPGRTLARNQEGGKTPDLARYVNPFVGTAPGATDYGTGGGAGNNFPGADVPFGMVQWSPDTVQAQPGGYYYPDDRIKGFSLTHLSGAGCYTYEDIPFMPYVGKVTESPATNPDRYVARFSHDREAASPGYYRVRLDNGVKTELTVTKRTGMGRFTYPKGKPATMLINVSGSATGVRDASVTVGRDTVSGWATSGNFCGAGDTYRVHFWAKFSEPFRSFGTWHNGSVKPGERTARGGSPEQLAIKAFNARATKMGTRGARKTPAKGHPKTTVSGPGSGAYVTFRNDGRPITVRIGVSFVSVKNAKGNVAVESHGSFAKIRDHAREEWNSRLAEIRIKGGTPDERTNFYTALYHAFLQPNVFSDANGQYVGFDGRVHSVRKGHAAYTNFSGWDIYRSETQLLALLAPKEASDIAQTMVDFARQGGSWDRWTVANDYTGVMVGDPYHSIVASTYAFGARGFDAREALRFMVKGATKPTQGYVERPGLEDYKKLGYVPVGAQDVWGPAATTLEYTTADFGIAQLAKSLGDEGIYHTFMQRAQYWENLFNPDSGYIQPRNRDGSFVSPFDPSSMDNYVEGNGAQYTWMVPYNLHGLFNAMGGDEKVVSRLDEFFTKLNAGPQEPYAFLGNEPTLETPWEYDYAGAPYKTQQVVREAVNTLYRPTAGGYVGNDDLGEMSSWYVWAAMGMYPEVPGRAELVLASPLFPRIVIHSPGGQTIRINAPQASTDTYYVKSLKVDGRPSTKPWLPASFVRKGGTLDYTLSTTPDESWGSAREDAPPSFRQGEVPYQTYASPSRVVVEPGGSTTATIGAQSISGGSTTVSWSANPPSGLSTDPSSGSFMVPAGSKGTVQVKVSAASDTPEGYYRIPVTLQRQDGSRLQDVAITVVVAKPGSLLALFNNTGISSDDDPSSANYDGVGYSYSEQALATAGVKPGGTVSAGGMEFVWPNVPAGEPDNIAADGQTINLSDVPAGASELAFLGSATNGPSQGEVKITYTDGSTQTATLGFSDWTLNAGSSSPSFGNVVAAKMPYRNSTSGNRDQVTTYVFASRPIPLEQGKQPKSVTLPSSVDQGTLHVFAVSVK